MHMEQKRKAVVNWLIMTQKENKFVKFTDTPVNLKVLSSTLY